MFAGDLGFRVFKLASSNIRAWEPDRDNLAATLAGARRAPEDRPHRADILFELLLKLGLDLTVPIEQKCIAGKTVHSIGAGMLMVCLAEKITTAEVEPLALGIVAWHKELAPAGDQVVFRDSAFTASAKKRASDRRRGQDQPDRHPPAARAGKREEPVGKEPLMPESPMPPQGEIVLYRTEDGRTRVECRFANETMWLSQALIAELFQVTVPTINEHLQHLYEEGELARSQLFGNSEIVRREGAREVAREIEHYNLDVSWRWGIASGRIAAPSSGSGPPSG